MTLGFKFFLPFHDDLFKTSLKRSGDRPSSLRSLVLMKKGSEISPMNFTLADVSVSVCLINRRVLGSSPFSSRIVKRDSRSIES